MDFSACLVIGVDLVPLLGVSKVVFAIGSAGAIVFGNVAFVFVTETGMDFIDYLFIVFAQASMFVWVL